MYLRRGEGVVKCKEARSLMSLGVDNELEGDAREELAIHLAMCPQCWAKMQELSKTVSLLRLYGRTFGKPGYNG